MRRLLKASSMLAMTCVLGCGAATEPGMNSDSASAAKIIVPIATSLSAGPSFTCALAADGRAFCWGRNDTGQLGTGTLTDALVPTALAGSERYVAIEAADGGSCALTAKGVVQCWGSSWSSNIPVSVVAPKPFVQMSTGGRYGCGLDKDGIAYCWGDNQNGQLGVGDNLPHSGVVAVGGAHLFTSISAGLVHACALTAAGEAYCWGSNSLGELGLSSTVNSFVPARVTEYLTFSMISAGGAYTCGLGMDHQTYCWGVNPAGQLGTGDTYTSTFPRRTITDELSVVHVGNGNSTLMPTCGIRADHLANCWGVNDKGQLGAPSSDVCVLGTTPYACALASRQVLGIPEVQVIDPNVFHTCAMTSARRVYCWGDNSRGELGNGTTAAAVGAVSLELP